jgi:threonine dehydrogenase-like Zn-dependent dehydrogenase
VTLDSAALLEPLSVAIHATRRASIEQGDTVIVFGAGTVGLLVAAMAKMSGATTVVIADIDSGRVNYALSNGFAHKGYIVAPRRHLNDTSERLAVAKEIADDIMQVASLDDIDFEGSDATFDCTGKEICMQAGLYASLPHKLYVKLVTNMQAVNKTWWKARHGRHGHSHTDTSHLSSAPERSRHHRYLPLCKYIPYRNQDSVLGRNTQS